MPGTTSSLRLSPSEKTKRRPCPVDLHCTMEAAALRLKRQLHLRKRPVASIHWAKSAFGLIFLGRLQEPRPAQPFVTCNLRCSIATSDAPMHHLTLQTDRHNSAISRRISRFQARSPSSRPEKPVFMQSSAMRTQASVLDLQLQMDTLPRGPCHGFAIDALSRTLRPVSRHHVRSGT